MTQPAPGKIKSALMALVADAENLEAGHGAAEAEAKVSALKATMKKLKKEFKAKGVDADSEIQNLGFALESANAEIKRLGAEQETQKKTKGEDLPPEQDNILVWMKQWDSVGGVEGIVRNLGMKRITAAYHADVLCDLGYIAGIERPGTDYLTYTITKKGRLYLGERGKL